MTKFCKLLALCALLMLEHSLPSHAATSIVAGAVCSYLGETTMATNKQDLVACMYNATGALIWKSMTGGAMGSPNYNERVGVYSGWIADETTIVYFECNIGAFDVYVNDVRVAEGRDGSYDGYDQRQFTAIVAKGDRLSYWGAVWPMSAWHMTK